MTTSDKIRMTTSQHAALTTSDADGRLSLTDRRVIGGLLRRGWVREERRRKQRWWVITAAGVAALQCSPEIVPPPLRVNWRSHWERRRLSPGQYHVEGHDLVRPARGMLWRVRCPHAPADTPIGYRDSLAEAVGLLASHIVGGACVRIAESGHQLEVINERDTDATE